MIATDQLNSIFNRLEVGIQTADDIQVLRQAHLAGDITFVTGERAVALGGSLTDVVVVTGDCNVVRISRD